MSGHPDGVEVSIFICLDSSPLSHIIKFPVERVQNVPRGFVRARKTVSVAFWALGQLLAC